MDYVGWQRVVENSIVARGPVEFWGAIIRSTAGSAGTAVVFDGVNALGRRYCGYIIPQNSTQRHLEIVPDVFQQGIFVTVDVGIAEVLIRYRPLREEDFYPGFVSTPEQEPE